MTKPKQDTISILIIIGMILLVTYTYNTQFSRTSLLQSSGNSLTQYAGRPETFQDNSYKWIETNQLPLDFGETAIIGDYKIIVQKTDRGKKYGPYYCASNTCGGAPIGTDEFGCQLYDGLTAEQQVCSASGTSTSGSSGVFCVADCGSYPSDGINCRADCGCSGGSYSGDPCGPKYQCSGASGGCTATVATYCQFPITCGGQTRDVLYEGIYQCWSKADVYYKNQLVTTMDWDNRVRSAHISGGQEVAHSDERLHIQLQSNSQYVGSTCWTIESDYLFSFKPQDFALNMSGIATEAIEGDIVRIYFNITNNYDFSSIYGNLVLLYEIPTSVGTANKTEERILSLPVGISSHFFDIPTAQVPEFIYVKPKIDVVMNGSSFSGINGRCYRQTISERTSLASCQFVQIGVLEEPTLTIKVISSAENIINQLQQNITFLEATLLEKVQIIGNLNLTITQQATLINSLNLNISQMASIISNLDITLGEQGELIDSLKIDLTQKASIIDNLNMTFKEQEELITSLKLDINQKIDLVNKLNLSVEEKQQLIASLLENSNSTTPRSSGITFIIIAIALIFVYAILTKGIKKGIFRRKKK